MGSEKKSNFAERMINMFIWVPVLILIVFVFTGYQHLLANLMIIFFSVLAGIEMGKIIGAKGKKIDLFFYPFLAGLFPALSLVMVYLPQLEDYLLPVLVLTMLMILAKQTFVIDENELEHAIDRVTSVIFALFYPGFFLSYMIKFATLPNPVLVYAFFLLMIMLNDGMAYFVGYAFGKKTKSQGFILVSPNKSLVGFVGGIITSIGIAVFFYYFKDTAVFFKDRSVFYAVIMGLICGFATIAGDLFESTIKRSAGVKDSGNFFRGRGGVLDSFDSLLYAAPIFYYFLYFA